MELTDKLIIEKGLEELRKVDKFTIKKYCSGFEHYVNLYFVKDEENYAINQIEYIEDRVDAGWGDVYIYELIKLTPEIKQERRKKFIDDLVSKIEKENNIKLKVESYDI